MFHESGEHFPVDQRNLHILTVCGGRHNFLAPPLQRLRNDKARLQGPSPTTSTVAVRASAFFKLSKGFSSESRPELIGVAHAERHKARYSNPFLPPHFSSRCRPVQQRESSPMISTDAVCMISDLSYSIKSAGP